MSDDYDQGIHIPTFNARRRAEIEAKATQLQSLRTALAKSEEARETAEFQAFSLAETAMKFEALTEAAEASLSRARARIEELEKALASSRRVHQEIVDAYEAGTTEHILAVQAVASINAALLPATPIDGGKG